MAAPGQCEMITIFLVPEFKLNEPWIYWADCLPLESPEGLSANHNSTEHFCKDEYKKV